MARRRGGLGLLGIAALAAGAWWVFGRGASAATTLTAAQRNDIFSRARALTEESILGLQHAGMLPKPLPDRVEVYEDPQHVGPAMQISPTEWVVGPTSGGAPAGASGYGSLLYPTDVYATRLAAGGGPSITPGLWF